MKARSRIIAFFLLVFLLIGLVGTTSLPIAKDINLGLDLQGGFEVLYQVEELEEKAPILFTPEKRRKAPAYLKYAAIGLIALGISGFTGLNIYSSQVSRHNIAEQQQAQEQLQEQIQQATFVIDNPLPAVTFNVAKQTGSYHIVAGAFRVEENAKTKVAELRKEGFKAHLLGENKYGLHQVVYASHEKRRDAINMLREVKAFNEAAWLLVQEL